MRAVSATNRSAAQPRAFFFATLSLAALAATLLTACSDNATEPTSSYVPGPSMTPDAPRAVAGICQFPCQVNPGRILFADSTLYGSQYSINPDGTGLKVEAMYAYDASWTPAYDRYVVAAYSLDVLANLYLSATPNSPQMLLTGNGAVDEEPAVSPDGSKVAFVSDRVSNVNNEGWEVFVLPFNRQWLEQGLTQLTFSPGHDRWPHWAPNGNYIVYASQRTMVGGIAGSTYHIWRMSSNGSGQAPLNLSIEGRHPVYSPDGTKIAFSTKQRNGTDRIAVMNADGTNPVVIVNGLTDSTQPTWSRDGKRIAFASNDPAYKGINVMNADGTNVVHIYNSGSRPRWAR